jgi:hypothetical protein
MKEKQLPSLERLMERLRYDESTGELYWLDDDTLDKRWRNRFVGKPAGVKSYNADGTPKCILVGIDYVSYKAHRVIWKMIHGVDPPERIDHVDVDPFNNRPGNIREASHAENMRNRGRQRNNICGMKGVTFAKERSHLPTPWVAKINIGGRSTNLGAFHTKGLAAVAHAKAALRHHGQYSYLRC